VHSAGDRCLLTGQQNRLLNPKQPAKLASLQLGSSLSYLLTADVLTTSAGAEATWMSSPVRQFFAAGIVNLIGSHAVQVKQPSVCCAGDRECPKSLLAPTDFGTRYTTRLYKG